MDEPTHSFPNNYFEYVQAAQLLFTYSIIMDHQNMALWEISREGGYLDNKKLALSRTQLTLHVINGTRGNKHILIIRSKLGCIHCISILPEKVSFLSTIAS